METMQGSRCAGLQRGKMKIDVLLAMATSRLGVMVRDRDRM